MSSLHQTQYELVFQTPGTRVIGTMRITIASDFEAPQDLEQYRVQCIAMFHMGECWRNAGYELLDIRRVEESAVSVMDEAMQASLGRAVKPNHRATAEWPDIALPMMENSDFVPMYMN